VGVVIKLLKLFVIFLIIWLLLEFRFVLLRVHEKAPRVFLHPFLFFSLRVAKHVIKNSLMLLQLFYSDFKLHQITFIYLRALENPRLLLSQNLVQMFRKNKHLHVKTVLNWLGGHRLI
jgi:hypothetical protein